jgi:ATP-dependent helicase/nuclease subunit B
MPDIYAALDSLSSARRADPLAPVTIIVPSHAAGIQLRRKLAKLGPFAGVRFETLPRIAELLAAGHLAAAGRAPLARPIGDYLAEQVALESQGSLERVGELPGYARALRRIFRRLRRGGIRASSDVGGDTDGTQFAEVLRLYDRFRNESARFYDDEDLLDEAAAVVRDGRWRPGEFGQIIVGPPAAESAGAAELLAAFRRRAQEYTELEDPLSRPERRFVLAPDPASEAREAAREVLAALEASVPIDEIAVFHGADRAYRRLLCEEFAAADVPAVPLPGIPLIETRAGRAALAFAQLPQNTFSRTSVMEFFSIAPLRSRLPAADGSVAALPAAWDRVSRQAGITKGAGRWSRGLEAFIRDMEASSAHRRAEGNESRAQAEAYVRDQASDLRNLIEGIVPRLERLIEPLAAAEFISAFGGIVKEYLDPSAEALDDVLSEIAQLGTVGAVGGSFSLAAFTEALRANLEAAYLRPRTLGTGIAVADYRAAAGLRFEQVILCGAYEGSLPAGPGSDPLVDENIWAELRRQHPYIEDVELRVQRNQEAAARAVQAAGNGTLVWTAPRHEPGGAREYYPSPQMRVEAAVRDPRILTASQLRDHASADGWLRRGHSPISVALNGPVVTPEEAAYRWAIGRRRAGDWLQPGHRLWTAVSMLRARRSSRFTAWDGNLEELGDPSWLELRRSVSPTSLETYGVCGFRYYAKSLLGLYPVEEPEERDVMDAAARGNLIHKILERFFVDRQNEGRPQPHEAWTADDREALMRLADDELAQAEERGLTGLSVYSMHEARTIKADLRRFLDEDTLFRQRTGAVPRRFETRISEMEVAGVTLKGIADRVDESPDGREAWVIDYKSGRSDDYKDINPKDPLAGGTKLQLPVYRAAAPEAEGVHAAYWFITKRGGFEFIEYDPAPEQRDAFERTLKAILAGIGAGAFPAVSGEDDEFYGKFQNCRYCDYDRVCSRRRDVELATKEGDSAVGPWLRVRQAALGQA